MKNFIPNILILFVMCALLISCKKDECTCKFYRGDDYRNKLDYSYDTMKQYGASTCTELAVPLSQEWGDKVTCK